MSRAPATKPAYSPVRPLTFVVPGPIGTLSGGFLYDKRIIEGLRGDGLTVDTVELAGGFPFPDAAAETRAGAAFDAVPDGRVTVVDGLALGALPGIARRHAERLDLIALVHHPLAEETGLEAAQSTRLKALETAALGAAKGVIVTSPRTAEALRAYRVPAARVQVVTPGVDPSPLAQGSGGGPLALLTVGTVIPRKGHIDLVEALASLRPDDWRLTCIGSTSRDPETAGQLTARIAELGLEARVRLLGERDPQELAAHYQASDLFVLASHHEGYGMALSEALAHGLPVVSTQAGAIPGTVPADAGLLVPAGERDALADALARVIRDPALRGRLTEGARRARRQQAGWPEAAARFAQALRLLGAP